MNSRHRPELDEISAELAEAVPALRDLSLERIAIPLGGLSNSNYRLDLPDGSLVLRVPRPNQGPFRIDHQEEVRAACCAGKVGIGPRVLYSNPQGVMLTRFVENAKSMSIEAYRSDPSSVQRTAPSSCRRRIRGPWFKAGSGDSHDAGYLSPGLERPSAGLAMISGVRIRGTAEEVCRLIMS